jgi:hypothetical protein
MPPPTALRRWLSVLLFLAVGAIVGVAFNAVAPAAPRPPPVDAPPPARVAAADTLVDNQRWQSVATLRPLLPFARYCRCEPLTPSPGRSRSYI